MILYLDGENEWILSIDEGRLADFFGVTVDYIVCRTNKRG